MKISFKFTDCWQNTFQTVVFIPWNTRSWNFKILLVCKKSSKKYYNLKTEIELFLCRHGFNTTGLLFILLHCSTSKALDSLICFQYWQFFQIIFFCQYSQKCLWKRFTLKKSNLKYALRLINWKTLYCKYMKCWCYSMVNSCKRFSEFRKSL